LAVALSSAILLVWAPSAVAMPDLDDVKDEVEEKKEDLEDEVEEKKEDLEDEVEEKKEGVGNTVNDVTDSVTGNGDGGGDSSTPSPAPGGADQPAGSGGGDRGGDSPRERSGRSDGRRSGRRSAPGDAPPPTAAGAPGTAPLAPPPLITRASRAERVSLLGPSGVGSVASVPPRNLSERPSRAQTARLRRQLAEVEGCLGGGLQARALRLRAGGRSWVEVGSRLGVSSRRALSLGRFGLNRVAALAGGCGGPRPAGPVSGAEGFSQQYGAAGIGSERMLGMADTRTAGQAPGGEPAVAETARGGDNSVIDPRGRSRRPADGQSSYVGPPPPAPGLPLSPGEPASATDGGQRTEVLQAFTLLALALLLALTVRYRLRHREPVSAGRAADPGESDLDFDGEAPEAGALATRTGNGQAPPAPEPSGAPPTAVLQAPVAEPRATPGGSRPPTAPGTGNGAGERGSLEPRETAGRREGHASLSEVSNGHPAGESGVAGRPDGHAANGADDHARHERPRVRRLKRLLGRGGSNGGS
jgi:hypothetical protein